MSEVVRLGSPGGSIVFEDTRDHFENGVLRLLELDQASFEGWLAAAEEVGAPEILARIAAGFRTVRPSPPAPKADPARVAAGPHGQPGRVWHPAIGENPARGFAIDPTATLAWLVCPREGVFQREIEPPTYEESYFEQGDAGTGGYGAYGAQASWRMEKSRRQVSELLSETGLSGGRALDLGCGYGYFRAALGEVGWDHEGVEISAHARAAASTLFGFETRGGVLEDHLSEWEGTFDLVTMWDVIEHVPDPVELLRLAKRCLRTGGVVVIKTPSVDCAEAEVFGPHYHSLKREHLVLLTPLAIREAAAHAGLETVAVRTLSHLLVGFVGPEVVDRWAASGRGADIVAYMRRP